jgi:hypothetical protein
MNIPEIGTIIRYTGDMANQPGVGVVVDAFFPDRYQSAGFRLVLADGRDFRRLSAANLDASGGGSRFHVVDGQPLASADAVALIRSKADAVRAEADAAAERAAADRVAALARGRELAARLIPADAAAVIVAQLRRNDSDSQSDYHASSSRGSVVLACSTHTRDVFSEMRKACLRFKPTRAMAATGGRAPPEVQHGVGILPVRQRRHPLRWLAGAQGAQGIERLVRCRPAQPRPHALPAPACRTGAGMKGEAPDPVPPVWLRALLDKHACTQADAAALLRVDPRTVRMWLAGDRTCSWAAAELLRRLLDERSGRAALWR